CGPGRGGGTASRGRRGSAPPSAETEDATQPPAKIDADYDPATCYLGKPCRHGHTYRDTGQTLRRKRKRDCVQCHRESHNAPRIQHHARPWKAEKTQKPALRGSLSLDKECPHKS